jgi:hypothetical protein
VQGFAALCPDKWLNTTHSFPRLTIVTAGLAGTFTFDLHRLSPQRRKWPKLYPSLELSIVININISLLTANFHHHIIMGVESVKGDL